MDLKPFNTIFKKEMKERGSNVKTLLKNTPSTNWSKETHLRFDDHLLALYDFENNYLFNLHDTTFSLYENNSRVEIIRYIKKFSALNSCSVYCTSNPKDSIKFSLERCGWISYNLQFPLTAALLFNFESNRSQVLKNKILTETSKEKSPKTLLFIENDFIHTKIVSAENILNLIQNNTLGNFDIHRLKHDNNSILISGFCEGSPFNVRFSFFYDFLEISISDETLSKEYEIIKLDFSTFDIEACIKKFSSTLNEINLDLQLQFLIHPSTKFLESHILEKINSTIHLSYLKKSFIDLKAFASIAGSDAILNLNKNINTLNVELKELKDFNLSILTLNDYHLLLKSSNANISDFISSFSSKEELKELLNIEISNILEEKRKKLEIQSLNAIDNIYSI